MSYIPRGKIVVSMVNSEGKGVFAPDLDISPQPLASGATVRRVFESPSVPIPGIAYNDKDAMAGLANKEGITVSECEMPPGDISPMHATPSVDFGFMISGEVTLILDSGEEKVLK